MLDLLTHHHTVDLNTVGVNADLFLLRQHESTWNSAPSGGGNQNLVSVVLVWDRSMFQLFSSIIAAVSVLSAMLPVQFHTYHLPLKNIELQF